MLSSNPGHMPLHPMSSEMMFSFHHGAGGDHMTRPTGHFPGYMPSPWAAGQQPGELHPRFMMPQMMTPYLAAQHQAMAAQHAALAQVSVV